MAVPIRENCFFQAGRSIHEFFNIVWTDVHHGFVTFVDKLHVHFAPYTGG